MNSSTICGRMSRRSSAFSSATPLASYSSRRAYSSMLSSAPGFLFRFDPYADRLAVRELDEVLYGADDQLVLAVVDERFLDVQGDDDAVLVPSDRYVPVGQPARQHRIGEQESEQPPAEIVRVEVAFDEFHVERARHGGDGADALGDLRLAAVHFRLLVLGV